MNRRSLQVQTSYRSQEPAYAFEWGVIFHLGRAEHVGQVDRTRNRTRIGEVGAELVLELAVKISKIQESMCVVIWGAETAVGREPIALCNLNDKLRLQQTDVAKLSPLHQIPSRQIPYYLYVGGEELAELQRQALDFADALRAQSLTLELQKPEGLNHFSIVEQFVEADGLLTLALCR
jgi:hypothetical protein